jgi:exodeoxyribonuclease VII small subunit
MAKKNEQNDIKKLNFEKAIQELTEIVGNIESGQTPLEESLEQYEKAMGLIKHCRTILQKCEKRIEKIAAAETDDD